MQRSILMVFFMALMTSAWADSVYKCRNPQGKLVYQAAPCPKDAQPVSSWAATKEVPVQPAGGNAQGTTMVIRQHPNGHYFLNATVNGQPVTFVVDTGASAVSLPSSLAMSAKVYCQDRILMETANGQASACTTEIAELAFGPFQVQGVAAVISPNLGQPLLGMNVLRNFRIEQDNGEMRITYK